MNSYFQHYCTGCGLCQSTGYTKLKYREDGFPYPENSSKDMDKFCDRVCPMGKYYLNLRKYNNPWGSYVDYYSGYSNNKNVRLKASSGGILTEICVALLKLNLVDAIIQTKYDEINPIETVTVVNHTEDEVLNCAGSRYAVSSPLIDINNIVSENKKYAFVGKPCDVAALRNYAEMNSTIKKSVIYYFSFFCAGTPSRLANEKMLDALHCPKDECKSMIYRGNGWPGRVTAVRNDGQEYSMDYNTAWMSILGRVIRRSCKFCVDSIGEAADISCGDYWKLDEKNNPSFEEADGVNCIFTWTNKGNELLNLIAKEKNICIQKENIDKLKYAQPNHFNRRCTILYKTIAMRMFFRKSPKYAFSKMFLLAKYKSLRDGFRIFKGTVKRILQGRI